MTSPLTFDALQAILHRHIDQLSDYRKGHKTQYHIHDAAFGAFGIFFTQSPSFLDYQRRLQHTKGQNNAHTLLGVEQIPCDNQVRNLLDPIAPSTLDPVFVEIFEGLEQHGKLACFRVLGDQLLVALDGTQYFSSKAIHYPTCLRRQTPNGQTLYDHAAITPVVVCPGTPQVIALPPEYIMPIVSGTILAGGTSGARDITIDAYGTRTGAYPSCKKAGQRHGTLPAALAVRGDPPRVQLFSPAGPAL